MGKKYIPGRIAQNRAKAAKYILTETGLFLFVIVLQTTLLSRYRILGAVPDLCFGTLILVSYFCGKETGAVTGIAAGFAVEALGSVGISILPIVYLFCGYVCGYLTRAITPKRFTVFLVILSFALPVRAVTTFFYVCLTHAEVQLLSVLLHNVLPELLTTALFTLALFFPVKKICEFMKK